MTSHMHKTPSKKGRFDAGMRRRPFFIAERWSSQVALFAVF
ncbi:hypothetical protein ARMA_0647 [Ardenticatena maritima]|uniref:Uncharacterized protein n=1 Tax=Ardenticatena maritima TaxID=872965 RepID=A0A0M9UBU1_9CHLR|nr:hypothetical protein ARMA_0647 [Ardenticatena maritima]